MWTPPADEEVQSGSGGWTPPADEEVPSVGKVESFARGAANNFPMAPQAIAGGEALFGDKGYSENLSDWNSKAAEAKAANPNTYKAGAVTGAIAPLALPFAGEALEGTALESAGAPLVKAGELMTAHPIAGNAALGAAGAISNTDLTKNPGEIAKEAAIGAGIGGATAGILGKVMPTGEGLTEASNRLANKSVGYAPGILSEMSPAEQQANGEFLRSAGLVGKDKQEVLQKAQDLFDTYGKKIGDIGKGTEEAGLHIDPAEHYKAMQGLLDKSEEFKGLANKEARTMARDYKSGADDVLNLPDNPSWNDIQKLKEQYGRIAFKSNGEIKSEGAKDTYFALKDMLSGIAEKAKTDPGLSGEYKDALANYTKMHPVIKGLEKSLDADLRGGGGGMGMLHPGRLIAQMPGKARAILGPAAAAMGHPVIGAMAALPEIMNPAIQSNAAAGLAKALPGIQQGATQEIGDFLQSKFGKDVDRSKLLDLGGDKAGASEMVPHGTMPTQMPGLTPDKAAYRQGLEAFLNGDMKGAEKGWEAAVQANPKNLEARRGLERLALKEGRDIDTYKKR